MFNNSLDPLALKQVSRKEEKSPFPYKDFSPSKPQEIIERAPEISAESRIKQLEAMLTEKHSFDANLERESYDKAYLSGEKAGLALGQKRAEQILEKMQQLQEQTQQQLDEIRNTMSEAVIDIGGMLAEWLVGEITADDRARLLTIAKKAARSFPETDRMVLVVHQDDFSQFERLLTDSDFKIHLLTDNSVKPGCMRVASEAQDILIDPRAPIAEAVAQLKQELLSGESVAIS
ncbi:Flagellar biosynthesis/type III secretory pathway protein FliH [Mariprofundus aestuarium]|uniref:Flagellar assembly protein FliH n=1 Tax=Mariprofundus aestuarium TaxID=1921086 RepID=A0A2K8KVH4_MARES|nr:FliH/SctL family protein [Mariprofundus aestuarium]ATX78582.1 Flagellar biosynthesis/type III secretory pathway protein FliH [Mariprofundus aestuarium]